MNGSPPTSADGDWVKCDVKLPGKTVIITGANTGIGLWTAVDLAKREAKVIIACRNAEKAEEARKKIIEESNCEEGQVIIKLCDLSSFASIRKFAEDINQAEERLDILINNAGVFLTPNTETEDGFEMHFGVNHLASFLLTNLLLNLLKKSAPSRVVMLSSNAHRYATMKFDDLNGYSGMAAYSQSKLAVVLFSRYLTTQLKDNKICRTGVTVNCADPGFVKTDLQRSIYNPGNWVWKYFFKLHEFFTSWKTPQHGAQTSIYCAIAPELVEVSGRYFCDCRIQNESNAARNDSDAEKLWNVSLELTKPN